MSNIFNNYFNEEDEDEKLPSQEAAEQIKEEKVESTIFSDYFSDEEFKKPEPKVEEPQKEEEKPTLLERGKNFISAVKNFFKEPDAPKGDDVILQTENISLTADDAYLRVAREDTKTNQEIKDTQNKMVEAYLPVVKENPSLLLPPKRFSGEMQDPNEAIEYAKLAYNNEDDALRELIRQRLEQNGYQTINASGGDRNDEIKDIAKQYRNQIKTQSIYKEVLNDGIVK